MASFLEVGFHNDIDLASSSNESKFFSGALLNLPQGTTRQGRTGDFTNREVNEDQFDLLSTLDKKVIVNNPRPVGF